jgi:hypothetical protein
VRLNGCGICVAWSVAGGRWQASLVDCAFIGCGIYIAWSVAGGRWQAPWLTRHVARDARMQELCL